MGIIDDLMAKGKIKDVSISEEMVKKEFDVGKKDLDSALVSFEYKNYKWATIQAYYAIFHAMRAMLYKCGYREESHIALKLAIKELYIRNKKIPYFVYDTLDRGMELREMADYKENYSQRGAENLIVLVKKSIAEIEKVI
jgi:uncharacterized protein (UPF0332 family)